MQSVAVGIARDATALLTSRERIELLRVMMLARATEQRARTLVGRDRDAEPAARWRREPIGAGAASALRRGDRLVAPGRYVSAHLALEESASTGRTSAAPDLLPEAAGVALAVRSRDSHGVVLTLVDEGTMASPRWSESLAVAFERQLPLVVVVERDRSPVSTDAG
jgi:TPP-dependent pyruvate/acetoin dehydrogenase alpha subunit